MKCQRHRRKISCEAALLALLSWLCKQWFTNWCFSDQTDSHQKHQFHATLGRSEWDLCLPPHPPQFLQHHEQKASRCYKAKPYLPELSFVLSDPPEDQGCDGAHVKGHTKPLPLATPLFPVRSVSRLKNSGAVGFLPFSLLISCHIISSTEALTYWVQTSQESLGQELISSRWEQEAWPQRPHQAGWEVNREPRGFCRARVLMRA